MTESASEITMEQPEENLQEQKKRRTKRRRTKKRKSHDENQFQIKR